MAQRAVIHEEFAYAGHNAVIHAVCYNRLQDCFVSCDDANLRLWQPAARPSPDLRVIALPPRTSQFLQAIVFVEARHVYVAAALDGTLKIFDQELNEVASVFAARGAIQSLVFDAKHSRLFSGGVDGCAAWDVRGRPLVGPEAVLNPLYDLAAAPAFFHYATAGPAKPAAPAVRASFVGVAPPPHALGTATTSAVKKRALKAKELAWVQSVQLNSDQTRLYAQSKHRVDVFAASDGHHLDSFTELVPAESGAITAFVAHEKSQYLLCGCLNGYLFVLSVHPTSVVHVFKDHTMAVTGLAVHLSSQLIISSSLDGTVRLWDLEARRQAHRLDIRQPVHALELLTPSATPCRFYCRTRSAVQLFTIQSAAKEHLASLSPISILQRVVLPTAPTVTRTDTVIPGEKLSSTRRLALPSTSEDGDALSVNETQWIVAAGTDRTVRLFSGRAANEAPTFTWIPEEHALDMSGLALHARGQKLFLLLDSQKILIVDIKKNKKKKKKLPSPRRLATEAVDDDDDEEEERDDTRPMRHRLVDMDAAPLSILGATTPATPLKKSVAALAAATGESSTATTTTSTTSGLHSGTNVAANPALRGAVRCICSCFYPPIFRAAPGAVGAAVSGGDATAQLKWFSRTFVHRRQQSKRDLKRLDDLSAPGVAFPPTKDGTAPLVQSDREWIVCGSEYGHLVFWHSGLTNSFQEAISLDAHDAGVVAIAASASSPLCVSLDASKRVHVWQFQPVFTLRQMVELNEQPSCFVLAPTSELLLTGYEDGSVVFMNVSDALEQVETLGDGHGDSHDAMVSGADFLDAKLIVLTASVDAVVKIWDHQKTVLRQIQIAMALTCLCFMNDDGDVMAGVPTGIFMLSKDDLLPDKLPVHPSHDGSSSPSSRQKKLPFWLDGDESSKPRDDKSPARSSGEPLSQSTGSPPKPALASTKAPPGRAAFQKKLAVSFQDDAEEPAKQDETHAADRVEKEPSPRSPVRAASVKWKRRSFNESLALLMGGAGQREGAAETPIKALHPPVLRPLNNQTQRATPPTTSRPPSSRTLFPAKDPDWREVIMPSSPRHGAANPFAQRNRRLKPPTESSAIIAELKALAHAAPPRLHSPSSPREPPLESQPSTSALGIGHTEPAPLQYCKHQAPVPPKAKTPRKLWNAIGGEDRRLIAVQRNLPSLT